MARNGDDLDRLVEEAEKEYEGLKEHLRHLDGRIDTHRTVALGAVGAVLTLAIQQEMPIIALAGTVLTHCFALIDQTNALQYKAAADRARKLEQAFDARDDLVRRGRDDRRTRARLMRLLTSGRGLYRMELKRPGPREMAYLPPRPIFGVLYPILVLAGGLLAIVLQVQKGFDLWVLAIVLAVAVLWAATLRRYVSTERAKAWRTRRGTAAAVVGVLGVIPLAGGVMAVVESFDDPERPASGRLVVEAPPGAREVEAALRVAGECEKRSSSLRIAWVGARGDAVVALPEYLSADRRKSSRSLSVSTRSSPSGQFVGTEELFLQPGAARLGRCYLAVPALVGAGDVTVARTVLNAATDVDLLPPSPSVIRRPTSSIVSCDASSAPDGQDGSPDCSEVFQIREVDADDQRLKRLGYGALCILIGVLLILSSYRLARGKD